jgi:hypothetical protein
MRSRSERKAVFRFSASESRPLPVVPPRPVADAIGRATRMNCFTAFAVGACSDVQCRFTGGPRPPNEKEGTRWTGADDPRCRHGHWRMSMRGLRV